MVDPHQVQPQSALSQKDYTFDQLSNSSSEIQDDSNCQISMEKCISLELFLTEMPTNGTTSFSDELNTPYFADTNEELNVNNNIYYSPGHNPFIFANDYTKSEESRADNSNLINCGENSVVLSDLQNSVLSSDEIAGMDDINLEEYDLLTDCEDPDLWKNVNLNNATYPVPPVKDEPTENSNSSVDSHHNYALRLDLSNTSIFEPVLQTPDVINTICSFENDYKFKIQAEEVKPSAILANLESTSSVDLSAFSWPLPSTSNSQPPSPAKNRVSRKRKSTYIDEDDGDEDYVPPLKHSNYYESDEESEGSPKPAKKRGRPSKRASVSSDNSEPSKYREMRDKNNEASRKSRQKRRVQEIHHEEELNDLSDRNIKLKAQCSELEATVSRFRTNIMQLLLKK